MDRFWKYKFDHVIFWIATVGFHMFTKINLIGKAGFDQFVLEVIIRNGLLAMLIYVNAPLENHRQHVPSLYFPDFFAAPGGWWMTG